MGEWRAASRFTELSIDCHDPHGCSIDVSRDEEVERLIALGARRVDVGQGDVSWVVLADPEGKEFCVLRTLAPPPRP